MLAIKDIPEFLEEMYHYFKDRSKALFAKIEKSGKTEKVVSNEDLFQHFNKPTILYIREGFFKLFKEQKIIRLYSTFDMVSIPQPPDCHLRLSSDFATEVTSFPFRKFQKILQQKPSLFAAWLELLNLENQLNLHLTSLNMDDNMTIDFEFRQYQPGDFIIREGETPEEIYEMIDGEGVVTLGGHEIGSIEAGEFFGELSFLTDSLRTASVNARRRSMVRVIKKKDFMKLIRSNPQFIISISRNLARRIIELNQRMTNRTGNGEEAITPEEERLWFDELDFQYAKEYHLIKNG